MSISIGAKIIFYKIRQYFITKVRRTRGKILQYNWCYVWETHSQHYINGKNWSNPLVRNMRGVFTIPLFDNIVVNVLVLPIRKLKGYKQENKNSSYCYLQRHYNMYKKCDAFHQKTFRNNKQLQQCDRIQN